MMACGSVLSAPQKTKQPVKTPISRRPKYVPPRWTADDINRTFPHLRSVGPIISTSAGMSYNSSPREHHE